MALSTTDIRDIARGILYGTGLGEKPTLIQGVGTASVSAPTVTFSVASGTGASLRKGDVISAYGAADAASAYSFYVLSISTDALTCVNGYEGASIANGVSTALIFEVMDLMTEETIFQAINTVIEQYLWPEVFYIENDTVTPDLSSGQVNMDTADEELLEAWQQVGTEVVPIAFHLEKDMPTSLFASGNMGSFDAIDASTVYYKSKRRINATNSTASDALNHLIATGAIALALGGTVVETTLDSAKKDAQDRGQRDVGAMLWRDFLTTKQVFSEDLSRDTVLEFVIDRG